jgi:hypothetical protein
VKQELTPPFDIPPDVPASVRAYIIECAAHNLSKDNWLIIERLATSPLIIRIWKFLSSTRKNGEYLYSAKREPGESQTDAQLRAFRWIFHCAYISTRDKRRVWRTDEIERLRQLLIEDSEKIQKEADEANAIGSILGVAAMELVQAGNLPKASEFYKQAQPQWVKSTRLAQKASSLAILAQELPNDEDPMVIQRYRSDQDVEVKGTQIFVSDQLFDCFGEHFDNIAAEFASVAHGKASTREASRSKRRAKPRP